MRRLAGRVALVVLGLTLGSAAGEIGLRLFLPQTMGLRWYTRENVMVHVPGLRGVYNRPEFRTRVAINSDGIRDRDYPLDKPAGVYRILVLGDSFAEGLQVEGDETFSKRAEAKLRAVRPRLAVEVVNAGISGYGTADELRYLELFGTRWHPDAVLIAFYAGNDVRNNMTEPDLVRSSGGVLEIAKHPLTAWQYRVRGARNWLAAHSHLWQFLRDRLPFGSRGEGDRRDDEDAGGRRGGTRTAAGGIDAYDDKEVVLADPGPRFERGWKLTHDLILRIDDVARGLGARTAIVVIPSKWQNDPSLLAARFGDAAVASGVCDPMRPGRIVCGFAAERGIPCLDLLPGFRAAGSDPSWYWKLDGHFTAKAHEAAADLIAGFLMEHLLPRSNEESPAERRSNEERSGSSSGTR